MISTYNNGGQGQRLKNLMAIVRRSLSVFGFGVFNLEAKYKEQFFKELPPRVASGEVKYLEDRTHGLHLAGHALLNVQQGKNVGKSVVIVADD